MSVKVAISNARAFLCNADGTPRTRTERITLLSEGLAAHGPRPNDWSAERFDRLLFPNDYNRTMN